MPRYRKHRASGQAVVCVGGKTYYLGPHDSKASRLEYDRLVGEWTAAGRPAHGLSQSTDITVVELIARYWTFAKGYYRKNGRPTGTLRFIRHALRPLRIMYGSRLADSFGPLALKSQALATVPG
ncbi:MAG: site-specific integrase, partial [Pirellulales bacterium]